MSTATRRVPRAAVSHATVPAGIRVVGLPTRSTNLERDVQALDFPDLYIGVRTQEVIERLVSAVEDPQRVRSWSLTGPYGSGKSTLGLLIDALLVGEGPRRERAHDLLCSTNPGLGSRLAQARRTTTAKGFLGAVVTARREPVTVTVARALRLAAARRWGGRPPVAIGVALAAMGDSPRSEVVLDAVRALCARSPLLLLLDEFGKSLEYLAIKDSSPDLDDDLYVLQELAELGAGSAGLPLYLFTLQHLSFLDYAARSATLQTREWAKIQGRFEDITFTTHPVDTLQMLVHSMDHSELSDVGHELVKGQAQAALGLWPELGLHGVLDVEGSLLESLYPLHPLTALAAPLLAGQIGQNDRSLSGFLISDEPNTVHRFLESSAEPNASTATTLKLDSLYDYFLGSGRTTVLASANAARWIEIDTRLSEAHGLHADEMVILKTIAVLNLIDSAGVLRASADMVLFALNDPADVGDPDLRNSVLKSLNSLVERGFLVYREFSDEYRIWQGSDTDITARTDELLAQCDDRTIAHLIATRVPAAIVAGRHSQRTGLLRHFTTSVTTSADAEIGGPDVGGAADGALVYHLGVVDVVPAVRSRLPVVVGTTDAAAEVLAAGRTLWALQELLEDPELDSVARREVRERALQAAAGLAQALAHAFNPLSATSRWARAGSTTGEWHPITARSLAGVVSAACDQVFDKCPTVHNEMLGRHQLTSQGAKARRELLTAMIEYPSQEHLGLSGYGPDMAMYKGVLEPLGLHGALPSGNPGAEPVYGLRSPAADSTLSPSWSALERALLGAKAQTSLSDVIAPLVAPPYGLKAGIVPLVVLSSLLLHAQDIALFEDGSYIPAITADLAERLIKGPERFTVKLVPSEQGQRQVFLEALSAALDVAVPGHSGRRGGRNHALLSTARVVLDRARALAPYARRTTSMSARARAVRAALLDSRDPDDLVFYRLPRAVGFQPVQADDPVDRETALQAASDVVAALDELTGFVDERRARTLASIAIAFRLPSALPELRVQFRARVVGLRDILGDPVLRGLVSHVLNEGLDDEDWTDPLIIRISGASLLNWTDAQAERFDVQAREMARALDRVAYLQQSALADVEASGQTAQVLTVTRADGSEDSALVAIPEHLGDDAARLVDEILTKAGLLLGVDGSRILLASLARTVLSGDGETRTAHPRKADLP